MQNFTDDINLQLLSWARMETKTFYRTAVFYRHYTGIAKGYCKTYFTYVLARKFRLIGF